VTTLANAPLLEVVTQFRWAQHSLGTDGSISFEFPDDEQKASSAALESALRANGFTRVEELDPALDDVSFAYSRLYQREESEWPIIQTGLGVAGIHLSDDGYDWKLYKELVLNAFSIISAALQSRYPEGVPFLGCELLYLDGFLLAPDETPEQFLKNKLNATLGLPEPFLTAPFLQPRPNISAAGVSFEIDLAEPRGLLIIDVEHDNNVLGRPGFVMDTRVRSVRDAVEFTVEGVETWLELVHRVQKHAFETLISKAYWETFQ
jgi:uncharacterized protein (TIGR04255 family)